MYLLHVYIVLFCAILMSTTDVVKCRYSYVASLKGWVTHYKTIATWDEAFQRCQSEGAVLMSPLNEGLLNEMRSLIRRNTAHFVGTHAKFHPRLFASIEGVPLEDMPLASMYDTLDPEQGQCLSMNYEHISAVSCSSRLPYMCYKQETQSQFITECGTYDEDYKLDNTSGHCYKFHKSLTSWSEAYATCVAEGGHLAILDDDEEAQRIVKFITDTGFYVYIGLRDWRGNGDWRSIHGDPVEKIYHSWEKNKQPNTTCCEIGGIHPKTGLLNHFLSTTTSHFICEKDQVKMKFAYNS